MASPKPILGGLIGPERAAVVADPFAQDAVGIGCMQGFQPTRRVSRKIGSRVPATRSHLGGMVGNGTGGQ